MSRKIGLGMITVAWLMLFLMAGIAIEEWLQQRQNPNRQPDSFLGESGERRVILRANRAHQYLSRAQINGHTVTLLVDTGATDVVLPETLAQRLQLPVGASAYAITANGRVRIQRTTLEEIRLGSIVLRHVKASINPGMADDTPVLLGMSALSAIELRQQNGELHLIQRPES